MSYSDAALREDVARLLQAFAGEKIADVLAEVDRQRTEAQEALRLALDVRAEDEAAMAAGDWTYRQQQIADWMSEGEEPPEADAPSNACYRGNSVGWIYSKAENYKKALGRVWDALREFGITPDGKTHCADAVRQALQQRLSREPAGQSSSTTPRDSVPHQVDPEHMLEQKHNGDER